MARPGGNMIEVATLQEIVGDEIAECDTLAGSAMNTVRALTLKSGERVVFKSASSREIEVEVWALRSMAERGVPVPPLLSWSSTGATPYLVSRFVSAQSGLPTEAAAARAGALLRAVHALPVDGVGFLKESGVVAQAIVPGSWPAYVAAFGARLQPLANAGVLGLELHDRCRDVLAETERWAQPLVFAHGDFHARHMLGLGTKHEVIIDWADCAAAPVWLDLARLDVEGADQSAFLDAYFPSGSPPEAKGHLSSYKLLYSLVALVWEYEGGGDWIRERVPAIEAALNVLSGPTRT